MSGLPSRERTAAAVLLLVARTVYAYNWYDIGVVPTPVERQFGVGTIEFGIVLAGFLVGAAIFQIPAGFAALRWGNRTVTLAALGGMGTCALASAFAPSWTTLATLRFGTGVGAAFFFAPALGLITGYYPEGTRGPIIGIYNGGFSLGSAVGLIGGALITESVGWRANLGVGGALLLGVLPFAVFLLPRTPRPTQEAVSWKDVRASAAPVFASRPLWALTLSAAGLWAGYYIAAQYFVEFAAVVHPTWSLALAAGVPTAMILTEILSGPLGGWSADRSRDMRRIMLAWGLAAVAVLALVPFLSFAGIWPAFVVLGFSAGVTWTALYLIPTYFPGLDGERFSLAVGLMNSVQIFLGSALTLGFALIAAGAGFTAAWIFAAAVSAAFLPGLLAVGPVRGVRRTAIAPGVDDARPGASASSSGALRPDSRP